jgi:hypothetical protein
MSLQNVSFSRIRFWHAACLSPPSMEDNDLKGRLNAINARFSGVDARLEKIDVHLHRMEARIAEIERLIRESLLSRAAS